MSPEVSNALTTAAPVIIWFGVASFIVIAGLYVIGVAIEVAAKIDRVLRGWGE